MFNYTRSRIILKPKGNTSKSQISKIIPLLLLRVLDLSSNLGIITNFPL